MSNIPSFKTGSKPKISQEEYQAQADKMGSKYLNDPGTYDLLIKSAKWREQKQDTKDTDWVTLELECENVDGAALTHYLLVPTTAEGSFLYGPKKTVMPFESLQKFLRGFGVVLDFDNAMDQIGAIFGDVEKLVGKSFKARVGYESNWIQYTGKDAAGNKRYVIVDKTGLSKCDEVFADAKAAQAYAKEHKIQTGFIRILEVFSSKEQTLSVDVAASATVDADIPF